MSLAESLGGCRKGGALGAPFPTEYLRAYTQPRSLMASTTRLTATT